MPSIVISPNLNLNCDDQQWNEIKTALFSGRKIEAIKVVRGILPQAGLAEAKSYVEKIENDLREQEPGNFTGNRDDSPILLRALIFVAIVAAVGFLIFKLLHK